MCIRDRNSELTSNSGKDVSLNEMTTINIQSNDNILFKDFNFTLNNKVDGALNFYSKNGGLMCNAPTKLSIMSMPPNGNGLKNYSEGDDFEISGITDDGINIVSPYYRHDVYREIDVIEEILRVYGFDNIKIENKISMTIPEIGKNKINVIETIISKNLVGIGFNEIINNSICSPSINQRYSDNPISILNPQGTELSNLRASLIPNMLETIKHNSNRQNRNLKLFEFGNSYSLDKENYYENKRLNVAITGDVFEENWITDYKENNFYYCLLYTSPSPRDRG